MHIVNSLTSNSALVRIFLQKFVLKCLQLNNSFKAQYVVGLQSPFPYGSQNDQKGQGTRIILPSLQQSSTFPVSSLQKFLEARPRFEGFLVVHDDKSPLTRFQSNAQFPFTNHILLGLKVQRVLLVKGYRIIKFKF